MKETIRKLNLQTKTVLKLSIYLILGIVLFYGFFWKSFQINSAFPAYFTHYSKDFNENSFDKIKIGDDKTKADSLLGKPLTESVNNGYGDSIMEINWYSKEKAKVFSYDRVSIIFYKDKVVDKIRVTDMD